MSEKHQVNPSVSDLVKVFFNRENAFSTELRPEVLSFFSRNYGIGLAYFLVVKDGFSISVCQGSLGEVMPELADELGDELNDEHLETVLQNASLSEDAPVSEAVFRQFFIENADYFGILDNESAECIAIVPEIES